MKVLYYTSTPFLDIAIEVINILKENCELHVLIEVTPSTAHRIGINKSTGEEIIISPTELLEDADYKYLEPYLDGCASSNLVINSSDSGFSFSTLKVFYKTWRFIRTIQPDVIHLESISLRALGLLPYLFSKRKIFYTIHDPIPHSGEGDWKFLLPKRIFYNLPYPRSYFFYSDFAKDQFEQYYRKDLYPKRVIRMYPYSFYNNYAEVPSRDRKHILFFGSLSHYKGIDILFEAMPLVFEVFPSELLIVAGRKNDNYRISEDFLDTYKDKIKIIDKYISNRDLVVLIQEAKFVVCPYLDATQSGVLMTAYAFNTPVIASSVGAFPEYIENNTTGMLVPVSDPVKLADAINLLLTDNLYLAMEQNIKSKNETNLWINNKIIILDAYSQC